MLDAGRCKSGGSSFRWLNNMAITPVYQDVKETLPRSRRRQKMNRETRAYASPRLLNVTCFKLHSIQNVQSISLRFHFHFLLFKFIKFLALEAFPSLRRSCTSITIKFVAALRTVIAIIDGRICSSNKQIQLSQSSRHSNDHNLKYFESMQSSITPE